MLERAKCCLFALHWLQCLSFLHSGAWLYSLGATAEMVIEPETIMTHEGATVHWTCSVPRDKIVETILVIPPEVARRDGRHPVYLDPVDNNKIRVTLYHARRFDAGVYQCKAIDVESSKSYHAQIEVKLRTWGDFCRDSEFRCFNSTCMKRGYLCNGQMDCDDGSDEQHCRDSQCFGQYRCRGGGCVEKAEVCDGHPNCVDGSDEEGCPVKEGGMSQGSWRALIYCGVGLLIGILITVVIALLFYCHPSKLTYSAPSTRCCPLPGRLRKWRESRCRSRRGHRHVPMRQASSLTADSPPREDDLAEIISALRTKYAGSQVVIQGDGSVHVMPTPPPYSELEEACSAPHPPSTSSSSSLLLPQKPSLAPASPPRMTRARPTAPLLEEEEEEGQGVTFFVEQEHRGEDSLVNGKGDGELLRRSVEDFQEEMKVVFKQGRIDGAEGSRELFENEEVDREKVENGDFEKGDVGSRGRGDFRQVAAVSVDPGSCTPPADV